MARFVEATRGVLDGGWPGAQAAIWRELVEHLRPDKAGKEERKVLIRLLRTDATGVRARFLDLLKATEETWYESRSKGRNASERAVLRAVKSSLADSAEDGLIGTVLAAIESFEQASAAAQSAFDTVRWYLSSSGVAQPTAVLADPRVRKALERIRKRLPSIIQATERALSMMAAEPSLPPAMLEPLRQVGDDLSRATFTHEAAMEAILDRHARVQRKKRKSRWSDRGERLVLMPGFGLDDESPPNYEGLYLHPFRVVNTYSMLGDLGLVRKGQDAETQDN